MIKQNQECKHPRIFKTFDIIEEKNSRMVNKEKEYCNNTYFFFFKLLNIEFNLSFMIYLQISGDRMV